MQTVELSVSTIGTNELQPRCSMRSKNRTGTFSFHNRNERTATTQRLSKLAADARFQFPQSERTNCNLHLIQQRTTLSLTFSFHNRNERTATFVRRGQRAGTWRFQFPQSERTNCNFAVCFHRRLAHSLSVSTIGTNELQPKITCLNFGIAMLFQFPQSERTNCNTPDFLAKTRPRWIFQFPQSERTNCNLNSD